MECSRIKDPNDKTAILTKTSTLVGYRFSHANEPCEYEVSINQNGVDVSYIFSGPYRLQISGEYREGKVYLNAGIGRGFDIEGVGKMSVTLIKVEVSENNIVNTIKRDGHRINPMQRGKTTGQYGYSKHTKAKPIITNIQELKHGGEMSSDEEQI